MGVIILKVIATVQELQNIFNYLINFEAQRNMCPTARQDF